MNLLSLPELVQHSLLVLLPLWEQLFSQYQRKMLLLAHPLSLLELQTDLRKLLLWHLGWQVCPCLFRLLSLYFGHSAVQLVLL